MKMIRFSKYVALVIILTSVFGCDDAEMKAIDNGLYIQEAAPSNKFDQQIPARHYSSAGLSFHYGGRCDSGTHSRKL